MWNEEQQSHGHPSPYSPLSLSPGTALPAGGTQACVSSECMDVYPAGSIYKGAALTNSSALRGFSVSKKFFYLERMFSYFPFF